MHSSGGRRKERSRDMFFKPPHSVVHRRTLGSSRYAHRPQEPLSLVPLLSCLAHSHFYSNHVFANDYTTHGVVPVKTCLQTSHGPLGSSDRYGSGAKHHLTGERCILVVVFVGQNIATGSRCRTMIICVGIAMKDTKIGHRFVFVPARAVHWI